MARLALSTALQSPRHLSVAHSFHFTHPALPSTSGKYLSDKNLVYLEPDAPVSKRSSTIPGWLVCGPPTQLISYPGSYIWSEFSPASYYLTNLPRNKFYFLFYFLLSCPIFHATPSRREKARIGCRIRGSELILVILAVAIRVTNFLSITSVG